MLAACGGPAVPSAKAEALEASVEFFALQTDPADAERAFQALIAEHPRTTEGYLRAANFYAARGDLQRAFAYLDKADSAGAGGSRTRQLRGSLRGRAGDLQGAFEDMTQAIALNPQNPIARVERAALFMVQQNRDAALADLSAALETLPDNAYLTEKRLLVLYGGGRYEEAAKDADRIASLGDTARADFLRGMIYLKMNSQDRAACELVARGIAAGYEPSSEDAERVSACRPYL